MRMISSFSAETEMWVKVFRALPILILLTLSHFFDKDFNIISVDKGNFFLSNLIELFATSLITVEPHLRGVLSMIDFDRE